MPKKKTNAIPGYDFSDRQAREDTAGQLFARAKTARTFRETEWIRYNDYYNFIHAASDEIREAVRDSDIGWNPAVVPDPFIMVESQVDPVVPEPEFRGRDDDLDSSKAKKREYACKFVCQNNRLDDMNTSNERRLTKYGDAYWKVYWDADMPCGPNYGDIRIRDVPVDAMYIDPTAGADDIQAAQYVAYLYRMHKVVFWRTYGQQLRKDGMTVDTILESEYTERGGIFDLVTPNVEDSEDTVQVMEFWYKDPETGRVGCTIQAGGHEVRHIPDYWQRTGDQNKLFPFVHYWRIRDENQFYNRSELEPIIPMVDAADRELANALLNDAFTSNDIVLIEENALAPGEEFTNVPGAVVNVRQNAIGRIARLGGLQSGKNSITMIEWILSQIQRTNRNYETNQGKASTSVKTASELAMLRSDVDTQMEIKKADRNAGFERLYELIDWSVLEFYDTQRQIFIGAEKPDEEPVNFTLDTNQLASYTPQKYNFMTGEVVEESRKYWPRVDVTVNAGDGVLRSKAATLQALQNLVAAQVTPDNYKLFEAMVEVLDIPQKQEIIEDWENKFAPAVPPEIVDALAQNPQLLQLVTQAVTAQQAVQQMQAGGIQAGGSQAPTAQTGGNPTAGQFDMMGGGASAVPTV